MDPLRKQILQNKTKMKGEKTMSKENVAKFYAHLESDPSILKKIGGERTEEALLRLAKDEGFEFSSAELKTYQNNTTPNRKLGDDELDNVAGGATTTINGHTYMVVTIGYGCKRWSPMSGQGWFAAPGNCGSCAAYNIDNFPLAICNYSRDEYK
jgi:predicted ribosomally synthesized peptide with nif11-like leader